LTGSVGKGGEKMNKSFIGASLIGGSVILVTLISGFTNFREVKQAEFLQAETQAKIERLATPTPTATPSATATPTPIKPLIKATSSASIGPVKK
jgi:hypothetical protein